MGARDRLGMYAERLVARGALQLGVRRTRPLLLVGHPRSGTGYAASLLQRWGLDVGHEVVGAHGVSAWYAFCDRTPPQCNPIAWETYEFEHVIHVVRRARATVASVAFTEAATDRFRFDVLGRSLTNNRVDDAITSLECWTDRIRERFRIGHVLRIEDDQAHTYEFVRSAVAISTPYVPHDETVNSRKQKYAHLDVDALLDPYRERLAALDVKLGYEAAA